MSKKQITNDIKRLVELEFLIAENRKYYNERAALLTKLGKQKLEPMRVKGSFEHKSTLGYEYDVHVMIEDVFESKDTVYGFGPVTRFKAKVIKNG